MSGPTRVAAPFLRATVLGTRRNADLVLPTGEPVALLVPQLLDLLDEPRSVGRYDLVTTTGDVLDLERPLRELDLVDGVSLRVVSRGEVPPAPMVHDLVETTESAGAWGRWDARTRPWVLALLGALLLAATLALVLDLAHPGRRATLLWTGVVIVLAGSAAASRLLPATAWSLGGLGVLVAAVGMTVLPPPPHLVVAGWGLVVLLVVAVLGWCSGRLRAAGVGAGLLVLVAAVAWAARRLTHGDLLLTWGVVATVCLVVLGLLPRLALGFSGVYAADAAVTGGRRVGVGPASDAIGRAHAVLLAGVGVLAVGFGAASFWLAESARLRGWPTALTLLLAAAFALRGRHFPLAAERFVIWAAAATGPFALIWALVRRDPGLHVPAVAALVLLAVSMLGRGLVRTSDVQAARLRRLATRLEGACVLASLPVLVGCFGVYSDLLASFR